MRQLRTFDRRLILHGSVRSLPKNDGTPLYTSSNRPLTGSLGERSPCRHPSPRRLVGDRRNPSGGGLRWTRRNSSPARWSPRTGSATHPSRQATWPWPGSATLTPSSRRSPGWIAGHRLAPSERSSGASTPRPEGVPLRAGSSRSSVTLIEYRSGLISVLSFDARPAFVGPSSNDCRCRFSSTPQIAPRL
jgi:hypothetical protein